MKTTIGSCRVPAATAAAFVALLAAGCTTVRSTKIDASVSDALGVTYFLPKKRIEVTVNRTPVKLKDMEKALTAAQAATVNVREAAGEAKGTRERLEREQKQLAATASAELRAKYADDIETAKAKEKDTAEAQANAEEAERALRAGVDAVTASGAECTFEAKVELMAAEPDISERYVARIAHNPLRDDTLTLKVGANGLLSSGNLVAADRTADFIVEAAGAIAANGSGGAAFAEQRNPPATIPCAQLPKTFNASFDPKLGTPADVNALLATARYPFRLEVRDVPLPATGTAPEKAVLQGDDYGGLAGGRLYYRSPVPVILTLMQSTKAGCAAAGEAAVGSDPGCAWQPSDTAVVMVPQAGPRSFIPMNSNPFVRTVNDVQFVDGGIASWTAERPSELLEIVRLPVRLASAIVSVPAQLVSLRVDLSSKENSLAELQRAQIARDERARIWQACLATAETDAAKLACLPAP